MPISQAANSRDYNIGIGGSFNLAYVVRVVRFDRTMDRVLLTHLPAVLAVARHRSFRRAASELGVGTSAISHAVRAVEERVGTSIFVRTTRSVALTESGSAFLETAERAAAELDAAVERLREGGGRIAGVLRINVPRMALPLALTRILAEASRRHPQLTIEVATDDALADIVGQGFTAGVRLGEMIAQDMVAVRLTPPFRMIMVAAPEYLERATPPRSLGDLQDRNCIGYRLLATGAVYAWDLRDGGEDVRVQVSGSVRVTDPSCARELALAGIGVAYVAEPLVRSDLAEGSLIELMSEASITEPGLFIYFPQRSRLDAKLRALLDVIHDLRPASLG